VQQREQERAAWKKERGIRLRERREQRDEEFRLHEQQGLSPPVMSEYSSEEEEEEEESDGGQAPPERWEPAPLTESRRGGGGTKAWGGREGARRRVVYERGGANRGVADTRRGGVWRRDGGGVGHGLSARQALEKEEAGLLHPEVGHRSSRHSVSRGVSLIFLISCSQGGADRPSPCACKGA
jgi:hypothetical protein